jgi:hypothetical protein
MTKARPILTSLRGGWALIIAGRRVRVRAFDGITAPAPTPAVNRVQLPTAAGKPSKPQGNQERLSVARATTTFLRSPYALSLTPLLTIAALLLVFVPSALAAAPEAPEASVEAPVHATEATFHGVVNPLATFPVEAGTYQFVYRKQTVKAEDKCKGTGEKLAPASADMYFGLEPESFSETVTGLTAGTEYAVCLVAEVSPTEKTPSTPVTFKTALPPETPEKVEVVSAQVEVQNHGLIGMKVKGVLNPKAAGNAGSFEFLYKNVANGAGCKGEGSVGNTATGAKGELAEAEAIELQPHTQYTFCLLAHNEAGEASALSAPKTFETLSPPPAFVNENESAPTPVTHTEATFTAAVNPENQETECHFQYGTTSVTEHTVACEQATIEGGEQGVNVTVTGLELEKTYHYRVVLKNVVKGEETEGPEQSFETLFAPTAVQTTAAEDITGNSANLGGKLNAGGEAKYYVEYGTAPCAATCGAKSYELGASGKTQETVTPIVVNDLLPLTTYHYWLVANNAAVTTPVHGAEMQFTTKLAPPSVQTGVAEAVTTTSAELAGTLDPGGEATYYFEYGTEPCGGSSCGSATAASGLSGATQQAAGPVAVTGLQPNTIYHYWLVAKNAGVTQPVVGEARQFTTPKSQAEEAAEAAAKNQPEAERAAAAAGQQRLEVEARQQAESAAAANAARHKQYEEVGVLTAALERQEAEANKNTKEEKAKAKTVPKCKKTQKLSHGKCVKKKSKSKKAKKSNRRAK